MNSTNRLCGWASIRQSNPSNDNKRNCADSRNRTANGGKSCRVSRNVRILLPSRFQFVGVGLAVLPPNRRSIGGILVFFVTIVMHESFHYWYFSLTLCLMPALALTCFATAQDFYKSTRFSGVDRPPVWISTNFLSRIRKTLLFDCVTKAGRLRSHRYIFLECIEVICSLSFQ